MPWVDFYAGIIILTDVACAALPIIIIRKLQMNPRKKIALSFVMSMGLLYVLVADFPKCDYRSRTDASLIVPQLAPQSK